MVKDIIKEKLLEVERQENISIFYACESGSRAWGFPSENSDYDVRFIYLHPRDWYLSIDEQREVIERPLTENIDLSGWEIRKALRLFRKSNPPLLEWLRSPVIYQQKFFAIEKLRNLIPAYYSPSSCLSHYFHMARGNFREYLRGDIVRVKKYFYVLRPLLGCKWIEADLGPVPMEFDMLLERLVLSVPLKQEIHALLERKKSGHELDLEPKIPVLNNFIEVELERLSNVEKLKSAAQVDTAELNKLFIEALDEVWK